METLYRAEADIDWMDGRKRVYLKQGKTSSAIPESDIPWLLECGAISEVSDDDR